MSKFKDETGNRYGKLSIINFIGSDKYGNALWLSKCDCGKEITVVAQSLRDGSTKSCGCLREGKHIKNEIGNKYGRLSVVEFAETRKRNAYWLCKCICGKTLTIRGSALRDGTTKSCGCLLKERKRRDLSNEIGKRYGRLVVLHLYQQIGKNKGRLWLCRCDCGNEIVTSTSMLHSWHKRSCGCLKNNLTIERGYRLIDRTGKTYNKLFVIKRAENKKGDCHARWQCKCECGNEIDVSGASLKAGKKDCGCTSEQLKEQSNYNRIFNQIKRAAILRGYDWNLTNEDVKDLVKKNCHYCGAEPQNKMYKKGHKISTLYSGLDRRDNSKGYSKWNVVPSCFKCNNAKASMSTNEFMQWIDLVHKNNSVDTLDVELCYDEPINEYYGEYYP